MLAQHIFFWYYAILKGEGTRIRSLPAHLLIWLPNDVTWRPFRDDKIRYLWLPIGQPSRRRRDGDATAHIGTSVRNECFGAVDMPLSVAQLRPGSCAASIGPGFRLGEAEGPQLLAPRQRDEKTFFL